MLGSVGVMSVRVVVALAVLIVGLSAAFSIAGTPATAQTPSPSAHPTPAPSPILIDPLDPRAGAGANRVGAPLLALLVVIGAGLAAAALTAVYVKVARRP